MNLRLVCIYRKPSANLPNEWNKEKPVSLDFIVEMMLFVFWKRNVVVLIDFSRENVTAG